MWHFVAPFQEIKSLIWDFHFIHQGVLNHMDTLACNLLYYWTIYLPKHDILLLEDADGGRKQNFISGGHIYLSLYIQSVMEAVIWMPRYLFLISQESGKTLGGRGEKTWQLFFSICPVQNSTIKQYGGSSQVGKKILSTYGTYIHLQFNQEHEITREKCQFGFYVVFEYFEFMKRVLC